MNYIIDRLEGKMAVCETECKEMISIPRNLLPSQVKEGDIIREEEGRFFADEAATRDRRDKIRRKMEALFERSPQDGSSP